VPHRLIRFLAADLAHHRVQKRFFLPPRFRFRPILMQTAEISVVLLEYSPSDIRSFLFSQTSKWPRPAPSVLFTNDRACKSDRWTTWSARLIHGRCEPPLIDRLPSFFQKTKPSARLLLKMPGHSFLTTRSILLDHFFHRHPPVLLAPSGRSDPPRSCLEVTFKVLSCGRDARRLPGLRLETF